MATTAVSDLSRRAALSTALRTQSGSRQHLPSFPGPPHAAHTLRRHHAIVSFRRSSLAGIARVTISRSYPSRTAASRSVSRRFPPAIRAFTNQPDAARPGSKASRIAATDAAPSLLDTSRRQAAAAARSPAAVAAAASAAASTTAAAAAALEDSLSSRGIPEAYSTDAQILSGEVEGFAGMNEEGEWILLLPSGRKRQYPRKRRSKPRVPLAIDPVDRVDAVDSVDAPRNAASNVRLPSDVSQIEESTPFVVSSGRSNLLPDVNPELSGSPGAPRGRHPSPKALSEAALRVRRERQKLQQQRQQTVEALVDGSNEVKDMTTAGVTEADDVFFSAPSSPSSPSSSPPSLTVSQTPLSDLRPASAPAPASAAAPVFSAPRTPLPEFAPSRAADAVQEAEGGREGEQAVGIRRQTSQKRVVRLSLARPPSAIRRAAVETTEVPDQQLEAKKVGRGAEEAQAAETQGEREGERRGGVEVAGALKAVRRHLSGGTRGGMTTARAMLDEVSGEQVEQVERQQGKVKRKGECEEFLIGSGEKLLCQPTNPQIQEHMALAERKAGNTAAARAWYRRSAQGYEAALAVGTASPHSGDAFDNNHSDARHSDARHSEERGPAELMSEGAVEEAGHLKNNNLGRCLQAWAGMEAEEGDMVTSRQLFQRSIVILTQGEPGHQQLQEQQGRTKQSGQSPKDTGILVIGLHAWAMAEKREGNFRAARNLLEQAEKLQPGSPVVLQSRALLEASVKNLGGARCYFKKATAAAPLDAACWQAFALLEARAGRIKYMRTLFRWALSVNPKSIPTLHAWACQEARLGTPKSRETARGLFRKCLEVQPGCVRALQAWGVMEHAAGDVDAARVLFDLCLEAAPSSVPTLQAYACLERQQGDLAKARSLLSLALSAQPGNAAALQQAAEVEEELGNEAAAHELFVRANRADRVVARRRRGMYESAKEGRQEEQIRGAVPWWVVGKMRERRSKRRDGGSLVFKRKVEDCYALSLVRTQKSMDKCKEDLQAQIAQCGGKPVRTEYPLAGGASKPSKSARPSAKK
ncbi:unnamed protein product [Closterium sp. Naga37s-1]|nr:unnamed protein product [Closterium sp. Naga37s-1]